MPCLLARPVSKTEGKGWCCLRAKEMNTVGCSRGKRPSLLPQGGEDQGGEFLPLILVHRLPAELKPSRYAQRRGLVFLTFIL